MNDAPQSITVWFEQLRRGNPDAAARLWDGFFHRLVVFARSEMKGANRRVADEEDIAAGVMAALCSCADRGKLPSIENRDSLWRLLLTWTRHDIADHVRADRRIKRGGGNVRGDSVFGSTEVLAALAAQVAAPETLAQMQEQYQALLDKLPDPVLRTIAMRIMDGYSSQDIATMLAVSPRTVQRKLELIRVHWQTGSALSSPIKKNLRLSHELGSFGTIGSAGTR